MKTIKATPEQEAYRLDLLEAMRPVSERHNLAGWEMLAVTAQLVGQLIAALDQTKYTPAMAMDLVAENVRLGNEAALAVLREAPPAGEA